MERFWFLRWPLLLFSSTITFSLSHNQFSIVEVLYISGSQRVWVNPIFFPYQEVVTQIYCTKINNTAQFPSCRANKLMKLLN